MGQFLHEFTEFSGEVPSGTYVPISVSGDTYKVKKEILQSGVAGGGATLLNELSDVSASSPTNGQILAYSNSGYWYPSLNSPFELQYTGVQLTGTMAIAVNTGWVNIISGQLNILSNTSKVYLSAQVGAQGSSTSSTYWFRIIESNLTSGTSGVVFGGESTGNRTPISAGLLLKGTDTQTVIPVPFLGIKNISGSIGDQVAYTIQGKNLTLGTTLYINRNSSDSDASTTARTSSYLFLREIP